MKRRPWSIVVLALLQLVAPLTNFFYGASATRMPWGTFFRAMLFSESPWRTLDFIGLPILAAVGVYSCRKWGYYLAFGVCMFMFGENVWAWQQSGRVYGWSLLVWFNLTNLAMAAYLLIPSVRVTYWNRKLRWWETRPRYRAGIPTLVEIEGRDLSGLFVDNLSQGGAYVRLSGFRDPAVRPGAKVTLRFRFHFVKLTLPGRIVHMRDLPEMGFGVQFDETDVEMTSGLDRVMKALKALDYPEDKENWFEDFSRWFGRMIRLKGGWVPEWTPPPSPRKAGEADRSEEDQKRRVS